MDQRSLDIYPDTDRLQSAFRTVLLRLSQEQFDRFWEIMPRVICLPGSKAKVFTSEAGVAIYFDQRILRKPKIFGGVFAFIVGLVK